MKNRVNLSALTQMELENLILKANFTDEQKAVFSELNKNKYYDYAIMINLNIPNRRYYNIKKIVMDKAERIAVEMGYNYAINQHINKR